MTPDRLVTARLDHKRRQYEVARAVAWALLGAILIVGLLTVGLLLRDVSARQAESLQNQASLKKLQEQNTQLLEAQQQASAQRSKVVADAIAELSRRDQQQLDEMERRILARQAVIARLLEQIRAQQTGRPAPRVVLVPVPTRPQPSPTPQPAPTPQATHDSCKPHGHSGKCK